MKEKKNGLLRRFLPYYKKYGWIVFVDLLFAALTTICEIVLPLLVKEITNTAMNDTAALTVEFILRIGIFYIVLRIIDTGANYFMISIGHIMGAKIETDMRKDLFAHLEKQSHSFYDNTKVGSLMSRMTTDLFEVTEFAHHCPEEFFIAGIKIIASFIILIRANWILTLITFAIIPFMIITMVTFRHTVKRNFADSKKQIANLNSQIEDSLLGIRVTKAFAKEELENEKHHRDNCLYLKLKTERYYSMGRFHSTTRLLDGIMYIVVVLVGGIFLVNGDLTAPDYVAYLLYVSTLLASVRRILEFTEQFEKGMSGIDRFVEIMDTEPEISDKEGAINLENVEGQIEFKNVSFSYEAEKGEVITDLNLDIKSGESVALVGPSGGGKTTLCSLIPRFYEATEGEI
ncbi:MAG: ABC transporter ATP-binding protein, partial [Clostridia bacterium]|nr:ABC transporter ATP-binding protein [Clostridia bacterium]